MIDGNTDRIDGGNHRIDNGKGRDDVSSISSNHISKLGEDDAHDDHDGPRELERSHLPLEEELVDAGGHNCPETAQDDPYWWGNQDQASYR